MQGRWDYPALPTPQNVSGSFSTWKGLASTSTEYGTTEWPCLAYPSEWGCVGGFLAARLWHRLMGVWHTLMLIAHCSSYPTLVWSPCARKCRSLSSLGQTARSTRQGSCVSGRGIPSTEAFNAHGSRRFDFDAELARDWPWRKQYLHPKHFLWWKCGFGFGFVVAFCLCLTEWVCWLWWCWWFRWFRSRQVICKSQKIYFSSFKGPREI